MDRLRALGNAVVPQIPEIIARAIARYERGGMTPDYTAFLATKQPRAAVTGIAPQAMPAHMTGFRGALADFAIHAGSSGCFADTGLGKTSVELEFARQAAEATNGLALILTPLAVAPQIVTEAKRWGYDARVIREGGEARRGVNVCNYDRLDKLDPAAFGAVVLDESSILKNFTGKTSRALIAAFRHHRFRLSATATPAPNDHMELGQHSEFCGIMPSNEMLMRWFIADQKQMGRYRLKGHAQESFWDWMASWCRMTQMPSDLGFPDDGFVLPALDVVRHRVAGSAPVMADGALFPDAVSATTLHSVKRQTVEARARLIAEVVAGAPAEPWVIWCDTDYEADALRRVLPDAIEVRGSMPVEAKEANLQRFADGTALRLITKPSICGFGLNWQFCAHTAFVGRSFSYEAWYQAIRRFWRFGQSRRVTAHLAVAEGEMQIGDVIDRKAADHARMKAAMTQAMRRAMERGAATRIPYEPRHDGRLPAWLCAA